MNMARSIESVAPDERKPVVLSRFKIRRIKYTAKYWVRIRIYKHNV